jgi:ParB/RepB/Spo0J family partition protein
MSTPKVAVLKVSQIQENAKALRTEVNKDAAPYLELKDSIAQYGLQSSVSVREAVNEDGTRKYNERGEELFTLVDGLHRFTAVCDLGLPEISANIVTLEDSELLAAQIAGNSINVPTSKSQFAQAIKQMLQHSSMTKAQLATKLNKSTAWIDVQLSLTKLTENLKKLLDEGKIVVSNAIELAKLPPEEIENHLEAAMTESPTVFCPRITERLKEIRAAAKEGRQAKTGFTPSASPRKKSEWTTELEQVNKTGVAPTLFAVIETQGITDPRQAVIAVLQWALHMDPMSVAAQKAKYDAEQAKIAEKKAAKEAEKKAKQDAETAKALAEATA